LRKRNTRSCGCLHRDTLLARNFTHRKSKSPEYQVWGAMIARCENPKAERWERYGGRGITICCEWRTSFDAFYRDMGRRPSASHKLDRIDPNGNYEPSNVRWATTEESANNTTANRFLTFRGRTMTVSQWGRELGIGPTALSIRLNALKWSVEKALTTPYRYLRRQCRKKRNSQLGEQRCGSQQLLFAPNHQSS
jgi:hypothetical protein